MKKLTQEEFIERSKIIHNYKYDYSLVKYINNRTKVEIICKEHGIFKQTPEKHMVGRKCIHCSGNNKKTNEEFIKEANIIHNNFYDYSLVNYINIKTKIKIICPIHGIFEQKAESHLNGSNCPKCSEKKYKYNKLIFIEKSNLIHNFEFDYSLVNYVNSYTKVKIICKKHGIFEQKPSQHLLGQKCPKCKYNNMDNNLLSFSKKSNLIHNNFYDYSLVDYVNSYTKVKIICKKHGIFEQKPKDHVNSKQGCPICNLSKGENNIKLILENNNINYEIQKKFDDCKSDKNYPLKFDFYLPNINTCIEFDGKQHFNAIKYFGGELTLNGITLRDDMKSKYCKNNNIHLIRIPYTEINNIENILKKELKIK